MKNVKPEDLAAVGLLIRVPNVIFVPAASQIQDVAGLVADAGEMEFAEGIEPCRTQFERLLALLETGAYGVLLAYNLARVARNFVDSFRFMDVLQRKRILLLIDGQLLDVQRPGDGSGDAA